MKLERDARAGVGGSEPAVATYASWDAPTLAGSGVGAGSGTWGPHTLGVGRRDAIGIALGSVCIYMLYVFTDYTVPGSRRRSVTI